MATKSKTQGCFIVGIYSILEDICSNILSIATYFWHLAEPCILWPRGVNLSKWPNSILWSFCKMFFEKFYNFIVWEIQLRLKVVKIVSKKFWIVNLFCLCCSRYFWRKELCIHFNNVNTSYLNEIPTPNQYVALIQPEEILQAASGFAPRVRGRRYR